MRGKYQLRVVAKDAEKDEIVAKYAYQFAVKGEKLILKGDPIKLILFKKIESDVLERPRIEFGLSMRFLQSKDKELKEITNTMRYNKGSYQGKESKYAKRRKKAI